MNTLLLEGLDAIKKASLFHVGFYYQAFFSLSIGIERLLKLIMIYDYRKQNQGRFPSNQQLKIKGHRINEMIKLYVPELLKKHIYYLIIEFLTDFADKTRYYNLDILTGKNEIGNPISVWSLIEVHIMKYYDPNTLQELYEQAESNLQEGIYMPLVLSDGTVINNTKPILKEYKMRKVVQDNNVLAFYEIIRTIVSVLIKYQDKDEYPDMRKIFCTFQGDLDGNEIKKKKNWCNEIR